MLKLTEKVLILDTFFQNTNEYLLSLTKNVYFCSENVKLSDFHDKSIKIISPWNTIHLN